VISLRQVGEGVVHGVARYDGRRYIITLYFVFSRCGAHVHILACSREENDLDRYCRYCYDIIAGQNKYRPPSVYSTHHDFGEGILFPSLSVSSLLASLLSVPLEVGPLPFPPFP